MRIIYFDIDCLRPDHLGCYGYNRPTSPTIDSIAKEGVRFENYYCSSSPCLPSRTALTSGRFGVRNGVISNHGAGVNFHLNTNRYCGVHEENEMFMRQLRRNEFDTIAISNFADRHNALWFMYGWSEYHTPNLKGGAETAEEVNEKAMDWLKKNEGRDDYYLHINYWDTHRCYKMDESWSDRFKDHPVEQQWPDEKTIEEHQDYEGPFTANNQFKDNKSWAPLMPGSVSNREDFEQMITGYDSSIAYVDAHIKEITDELERQGILDDTAIVISSDHGDAFGEHGIYSDHVCADECIHNIPLIIRWPGVTPPDTSSDSFMYNVDYAPTICDLLGFDAPGEWDGKSYRANVEGSGEVDRDYLVWDTALYTVQRAVRTKTHLYIETYDSLTYEHFKPAELYDMTENIYQINNIVDSEPEITKQCQQLMHDWLAEQKAKGDCIPDPLSETLRERAEK